MLHSRHEASANWNILRLATAAAGISVLAGCAVAMPLRPLATASQDGRRHDFACTPSSKCPNANTSHQRTPHRSQPVGGGNIADDPPDFIVKGEQDMLR
jgi:hypothetical protein